MQGAAEQGAESLVFGEAFWPGYPFWLAYTDGAAWETAENLDPSGHYSRTEVTTIHLNRRRQSILDIEAPEI